MLENQNIKKQLVACFATASLAFLNSCATQGSVDQLQREVNSLRRVANLHKEQLAKSGTDYYQSLQRLEQSLASLKEQKKEWQAFTRSYSPKVRQELAENLSGSEKVLKKLQAIADRCQALLTRIEKQETQTAKLQRQVAVHEREARKDNVVQQLRNERSQMLNDVKKAKASAELAKGKVKEVHDSVAKAEKETLKAKHSAELAKIHSKESSEKAKKVDSFILQFNKMSREISTLQAEIKRLKAVKK